MNYLPAEPKVHDHKGRKADECQRRRIARAIGLSAIATVALSVGFGTWTHSSRSAAAVGVLETRKNAVPNVLTMTVKEDKGPRTIELRNMAAFDNATLFARATGYISVRNVDIGSKVHILGCNHWYPLAGVILRACRHVPGQGPECS
ncbi:MAG: hypothetical protein USCAAHI_02565 [Beijerinckiaceae bacterium]|nr:MAG: hypothetical protein USCAAHI_02565 [Beijerinckiaceae bacterium]